MTRTVVITFADGSSHTYRNVPEAVTRQQVEERAAREFSSRSISKIERLKLGEAAGDIPTAPTAEQAAAGAVRPQAPAGTQPAATGPLPIGDRAVGALEAAGTLITAPTTGALSAAAGGFQEVARQLLSGNFGTPAAAQAIEAAVNRGAERGTFIPRTPAGAEAVQTVGEALQNLPPIAGVTGSLVNAGSMAGPAVAQAAAATAPVVRRAADAAAPMVARAADAFKRAPEASSARPAAGGSVGAMAVDLSRLRQGLTDELGMPPLLKGQALNTLEEQQKMHILAKDARYGEPVREVMADQRQALVSKMEEFVTSTGAKTRSRELAGAAIDEALRAESRRLLDRANVLYTEARKAGELEKPMMLTSLADHLNQSKAEAVSNPLLKLAKDKAIEVGALVAQPDGTVTARPIRINDAENWRKVLGAEVDDTKPNQLRQLALLKRAFDVDAEASGGALYKKARAAFRDHQERFEDHVLTRQLIGTKPGSVDRAVALEDVVERMAFGATSKAQLQQTGALIKKSNPQAWKEFQGAVIQRMLQNSLSKTETDERRTPTWLPGQFDAQIQKLESGGKLDYIFGKKNAETLRTMNEYGKIVMVPRRGAYNNSDSATILAAMIDIMGSTLTGLPIPAATVAKFARDKAQAKKMRALVEEQLSGASKEPTP